MFLANIAGLLVALALIAIVGISMAWLAVIIDRILEK